MSTVHDDLLPTQKGTVTAPPGPPHFPGRLTWAVATTTAPAVLVVLIGCPFLDKDLFGALMAILCPIRRLDPFLRHANKWQAVSLSLAYILLTILVNVKQLGHYYNRNDSTTGGVIAHAVGTASSLEWCVDGLLNVTGIMLGMVAVLLPSYWFAGMAAYASIGLFRCHLILIRPAIARRQETKARPTTFPFPHNPEFTRKMRNYWISVMPGTTSLTELAATHLTHEYRSGGTDHPIVLGIQISAWRSSFRRYTLFGLIAASGAIVSGVHDGASSWVVIIHIVLIIALMYFAVLSAEGRLD